MTMSSPAGQPDLRDVIADVETRLAAVDVAIPQSDDRDALDAERETATQRLVFEAGGRTFAASLDCLIETLPVPATTRVPGTPGWMAGVTNLRGELVSVLNLARFLKLDDNREGKRSVLVARSETDERKVGILVDQVLGIRRVANRRLRAAPDDLTGPMRELVSASIPFGEDQAYVANMGALVDSQEVQLLGLSHQSD